MITEVHRGCSTFITETVACAHMDYLDGKFQIWSQKTNQKIQTRIMQFAAKRALLRATTPVTLKNTPKKKIHASVRPTNCEFFYFS